MELFANQILSFESLCSSERDVTIFVFPGDKTVLLSVISINFFHHFHLSFVSEYVLLHVWYLTRVRKLILSLSQSQIQFFYPYYKTFSKAVRRLPE